MRYMLVTREVSQRSGWLKASACCRGSQAGHTVRGGLCGPGCAGGGERLDCGVHAASRGECCDCADRGGKARRTINIQPMSVTLEVSQLSGWLKAFASCRGSQAGRTRCGAGCGPGPRRQQQAAGERDVCKAACQRAATADIRGEARGEQRTANIHCMSVTLEVSQLSGWLKARAFCRGSQAGQTVCGAGCAGGAACTQRAGKRAATAEIRGAERA